MNLRQTLIVSLASLIAAFGCAGQTVASPTSTPTSVPSSAPVRRDATTNARLGEIEEANIIATHAWQVLLAQKAKKADLDCYQTGELSAKDLEAIVVHQQALLTGDPTAVKAWAESRASTFDRAKDLDPILKAPLKLSGSLPVSLATEYLAAKSSQAKPARADIRAVASLLQTVMEVNRDGEMLQQQFDFYIALGLAAYQGQLGLGGSDVELGEMAWGLSPETCPSPFGVKVRDWKIAARKIWIWGEKKLHIRDDRVLAREILQEADMKELVPKLKAMKAQRIAVIGHSFTMMVNWSSPAPFTEIAKAVFEIENPKVKVEHFTRGGMDAVTAKRVYYQKVLDSRPDKVFFFVVISGPGNLQAIEDMAKGFEEVGTKTYVYGSGPGTDLAKLQELAKAKGFTVLSFQAALDASPDKAKFLSMDYTHMTEPYHRVMAKEFLKYFAEAQ